MFETLQFAQPQLIQRDEMMRVMLTHILLNTGDSAQSNFIHVCGL